MVVVAVRLGLSWAICLFDLLLLGAGVAAQPNLHPHWNGPAAHLRAGAGWRRGAGQCLADTGGRGER